MISILEGNFSSLPFSPEENLLILLMGPLWRTAPLCGRDALLSFLRKEDFEGSALTDIGPVDLEKLRRLLAKQVPRPPGSGVPSLKTRTICATYF